jgi:HEAT repeat protein
LPPFRIEIMTGLRRNLGLLVAFTVLSTTAVATPALDIDQDFKTGVELLRRGNDADALKQFTAVLAADPSHEQAYELWKSVDHKIWLDLLVKGGQYELVAKRLMGLAELSRNERRNDKEAIRGLLDEVEGDDVLVRRRALRELSANHGEYAVQYMLFGLGDANDDDRRVKYMHALTEMSTDVVLPLVTALATEDSYLRRNIALTLGHIGDPRAAAALTHTADSDSDVGVQEAARAAAKKCGSTGDALALFLAMGDDYYARSANVLRAMDYSDVVWSFNDGLVATSCSRHVYADELSKNAYHAALRADLGSLEARAGIARAYLSQQSTIAGLGEQGADVENLAMQMAEGFLAVNALGADALDLSLVWCTANKDSSTGAAACRALASMATSATSGLEAALNSGDGALRSEAAVAMGQIAKREGSSLSDEAIASLGEAIGREVLRIAVVIDSDNDRGAAIAEALTGSGMLAHHWNSGASGVALLHRVPGVDVIVLAETLDDLTADQVLDEIARDDRTANVPVVLITDDVDTAVDNYGDRCAAVIIADAAANAVENVLDDTMNEDRARANDVAARAAGTVVALANSGRDLSGALAGVASAIVNRPDEVALPALEALGVIGGADHLTPLTAVIADSGRSDAVRIAAADTLGDIATRTKLKPANDALASLKGVLGSDASIGVRQATALGLGRANLTPAQRAELARRMKINLEG